MAIVIQKQQILIVDDEDAIRSLLLEFLNSRGYDCTAVCNGEQALDALKTGSYDVMLCDIQMPRMTGLDRCLRHARNRSKQ